MNPSGAQAGAAPRAAAAPSSATLAAAEEATGRGDIRTARARLREVVASGAESEKGEARERLAKLAVDPRAMMAAGLLFAVIAFAAWAGILRHH